MTILILGTFVRGSIENFYFDGLLKAGESVSKFEINKNYYDKLNKHVFNKLVNRLNSNLLFEDINFSLLNFITTKIFDVIIVFKGMTLFPDTIYKLKRHCSLLLNYNPDHPFKFFSKGSGNLNIVNSLRLYDIVITYSSNIKRQLINDLDITSEVIPFGYNLFKENNCKLLERKFIKFIGAFDHERYDVLSKLKKYDIQVFGDDKWSKIDSKYSKNIIYQNKKIYGDNFVSEAQSSLAVVNILRTQNLDEDSHNMRTFEIPALGGVLLSNFTEEQASFFEPQKEMLYYKSQEELFYQIEFLIDNPKAMEQISSNAFKRSINCNYSYNDRAVELVKIIKKHLS